eukprot:scaffold8_cov249-Pinguiococcus_pyrenoidosus.AAC.12
MFLVLGSADAGAIWTLQGCGALRECGSSVATQLLKPDRGPSSRKATMQPPRPGTLLLLALLIAAYILAAEGAQLFGKAPKDATSTAEELAEQVLITLVVALTLAVAVKLASRPSANAWRDNYIAIVLAALVVVQYYALGTAVIHIPNKRRCGLRS